MTSPEEQPVEVEKDMERTQFASAPPSSTVHGPWRSSVMDPWDEFCDRLLNEDGIVLELDESGRVSALLVGESSVFTWFVLAPGLVESSPQTAVEVVAHYLAAEKMAAARRRTASCGQ